MSSFTYNPDSTDATEVAISEIRIYTGDNNVEPSGILPQGKNIEDRVILQFYQDEGEVPRAVAAAYEYIAGQWAAYGVQHRLGPSSQANNAAKSFRELAKEWRERHGYAAARRRNTMGSTYPNPARLE